MKHIVMLGAMLALVKAVLGSSLTVNPGYQVAVVGTAPRLLESVSCGFAVHAAYLVLPPYLVLFWLPHCADKC